MDIVTNVQKLRKSQHIEFSAISGYNYYYVAEEQQMGEQIFALHAQSEEMAYLLPFASRETSLTAEEVQWHKEFVFHPMMSSNFEWPIDFLQCKVSEGKYILYNAFPYRAFLNYVPIKKLLYQRRDSKILDWRRKPICQVCRSFLLAMQQLDEAGYNYNDFNIERILYQETTGQVLLRYTPMMRARTEESHLNPLESATVPKEFAAPYIFGEKFDGFLPKESDYYSVAAILFRLMVGRLPYEGRGLSIYGYVFDPLRDVEALGHNTYFQHYHQYPHFIFDPEDDRNRMAPMQENDVVLERWEELPEQIKEMFRNSLCQNTAEHLTGGKLYSPGQWMEACNRYCWNTSEFGGE